MTLGSTLDQGLADWYRESAFKLPAGVFVWLDEFQAAFDEGMDEDRMIISGEREGDRELNYSPILEENVRAMVRAGFSDFEAELQEEQARREAVASLVITDSYGEQVRPFASGSAEQDSESKLASSSGFHEFDELAIVAGITGCEAAKALSIRMDGTADNNVERIGRLILTIEEIRRGTTLADAPSKTIHPLSEWLRRAKLCAIQYNPSLDWAVEHYKPADFEKQGLGQEAPPTASHEALRVAAPAIEAQPVPQEPPPAKTKTATEKHRAALAQFIGKVRAKAPDFDATHAPGRIADTLEALKAWAKHEGIALYIQSEGTLDRARTDLMAFRKGARQTTFYRDTFPEWFSK